MKLKRLGFFSILLAIIILPLIFIMNSCKHDGILADQMAPVPFSDVKQIYNDYCIKCHSGGGGESRLNFTDYAGIIKTVTPGNSAKSQSYQAMISTFRIMPPNIAMPTNKRTLIRLWIDQGANPN